MLKPKSIPEGKFALLLRDFQGNQTLVAQNLKVSYAHLREQIVVKPKLALLVETQTESNVDFVESKLFQRINGYAEKDLFIAHYKGEIIYKEIVKHYPPDPTCIIFFLKTRARSRGYVENVVNPGGKTVSEITFIAVQPEEKEPRTIDISPGVED